MKTAVSVVTRRTGPNEEPVREFRVGARGLEVGRALREFRGVIAGDLVYTGEDRPLLKEHGDHNEG